VSVMRFEPFGDPFRTLDRLTSQWCPVGGPRWACRWTCGRPTTDTTSRWTCRGIDPGSVEITCERNVLTIRAERRAEYQEGHNVLVAERPQGSFIRQLQVGEALDTTKVRATYDNGVLTLVVPRTESAQPRRIEVQSGGGGPQRLSAGGSQTAGEQSVGGSGQQS
jgi:HSP20 family protein